MFAGLRRPQSEGSSEDAKIICERREASIRHGQCGVQWDLRGGRQSHDAEGRSAHQEDGFPGVHEVKCHQDC